MASIAQILARNLKYHRGVMSQAKLAEKAKISVEVIRGIEQERTWPEKGNIEALADALKIDPADLFYKGAPPKEPPLTYQKACEKIFGGLSASKRRDAEKVLEILIGRKISEG